MAHNFKITTANRYISKAGNTANAGTMAAPKALVTDTIGAQTTGTSNLNIFGAGQYSGAIGFVGTATRRIQADGKVVFYASATGQTFYQVGTSAFRNIITDCEFDGYGLVGVCPTGTGSGDSIEFHRCKVRNSGFYIRSFSFQVVPCFQDSIAINCTGNIRGDTNATGQANVGNSAIRSLFFNSDIAFQNFDTGGTSFPFYCYFDETSIIRFANTNYLPKNCNIRGQIQIAGVTYANLAAAAAVYPILTGANANVNLEPQFTNVFAEDYTLKPTSPHLLLGIGPSHIRLGSGFYLKGSIGAVTNSSGHYFENAQTGEQYPIYEATNLTASLQSGQLRLRVTEAVGGALTGHFRTALKVSDVGVELGLIDIAAGLNFNTDSPALESQFDPNNPTFSNNNVPNNYNYNSGDAGRNPNRLDYSFRWSMKDNPNIATPTDWVTLGDDLIFEWYTKPLFNAVSVKGNGDPGFLPAATGDNAPRAVVVKWVDLQCVLMNNYFSK
jgi:hypothetical protein